jgi:hypothetical protein
MYLRYGLTSPWPQGDPPASPVLGPIAFNIHLHAMGVALPFSWLDLLVRAGSDPFVSAHFGDGADYWATYLAIGWVVACASVHAGICTARMRLSSGHLAHSIKAHELVPTTRSTLSAMRRVAAGAFLIAASAYCVAWMYAPLRWLLLPWMTLTGELRDSMIAWRVQDAELYCWRHGALALGWMVVLPAILAWVPVSWSLAKLCSALSLRTRRPFCHSCGYSVTASCARCPECGQKKPFQQARAWLSPCGCGTRRPRASMRRLCLCACGLMVLAMVVDLGALPLREHLITHSRWYREHWIQPPSQAEILPRIAPNREYNAVLLSGHSYRYSDSTGTLVIRVDHLPLRSLTVHIEAEEGNRVLTFPLFDRAGGRTGVAEIRAGDRLIRSMPAADLLLDAPDDRMVLIRIYTQCEGVRLVALPCDHSSGDGWPGAPNPPK